MPVSSILSALVSKATVVHPGHVTIQKITTPTFTKVYKIASHGRYMTYGFVKLV